MNNTLIAIVQRSAVTSVIKLLGVGLIFLFLLTASNLSTPEEYGVFASALSLATILGFSLTAGQQEAIMRFWPALDETVGAQAANAALRESAKIVFSVISVFLLIFGLAYWANLGNVIDISSSMMLWTAMLSVTFAISEICVAGLRARGYFLAAFGPREVMWRVLSIAALLLLANRYDGQMIVAIAAITLFVVTLPQGLALWRMAADSSIELPRARQIEMRRATWGLWASTVVGSGTTHVATVVVAMALGPVAAGAYFAADRLAKLLSIALIGVSQAVGPMISRTYHGGRFDELGLVISAASLIAFGIALAGFLVFVVEGRFVLSLFDPIYVESYPALLILSIGQLVNALCGANTVLLNMSGHERTFLKIISFWGVLGLPLVFVGAHFTGVTGAAMGATLVMVGWNLYSVHAGYTVARVLPWRFGPVMVLAKQWLLRS